MSKPNISDAASSVDAGRYAELLGVLEGHVGPSCFAERTKLRRKIHARMADIGARAYRDFASYLVTNPREIELLCAGFDARQSGVRNGERVHEASWLREMFASSRAAHVIVDDEGVVLTVNAATSKLLGRPRELLLRRPVARVFVQADRPHFRTSLAEVRARVRSRVELTLHLRRGDVTRPVLVTLTAHAHRNRILVSVRPLRPSRTRTYKKKLAAETSARARLERDNSAKDQFLAVVSHDLRGPISSVIGWTQLLRRGVVEFGASGTALATIERSARMQLALVEELLDVTRISAEKIQLDMAPVDLASVVQRSIDVVLPSASDKGISVRLERDGGSCVVSGDEKRLEQVVMNLLSNALKFTARGGVVDVSLTCRDGTVTLRVRDSGCGIAPELLPTIFERFRQGSDVSKRTGGLGLGLFIAWHVVELHRGTIQAFSEGEGRGSTFTVRLRRSDETVARIAESQGVIAIGDPSTLRGIHVLLVDDEADARKLYETMLSRYGARVTTAKDADQAMMAFGASPPDVLVCDIGLPGTDGYSLIRRLRMREEGRDVVALALTAFASSDDARRAEAAGFDAHVSKPVSADELVSTIRSVRRGGERGPDAA